MIKTALITLLSIVFAQTYQDDFEGKVVEVIDGNTIEVLTKDDERIKVMLKMADCPEISQEFGEEAMSFTKDLVYKKKVTVEMKGKDRWGNKLAVIKLRNGKILHEELLKNGLAWASDKGADDLGQLEASAKQSKTGLWTAEDPTPPWVYRRKQTMLKPKSLH